jgi:UDP-glucose 4-epimerase
MGMSKALSEKIMVAKSRNLNCGSTILSCTRCGNIMATRGSVIPLFIEQIKCGKPLTVTDPNMTRFMMTLNNAVDLVLFAFSNGQQGDIFIKKSSASTIGVLAKALKELYKAENEIKIIGVRQGEKFYETLINREEMTKAENLHNYYRIPADIRDLDCNLYFDNGHSNVSIAKEYSSYNTDQLNIEEVKKLLLMLNPIRKDVRKVNAEYFATIERFKRTE